MKIGIVDTMSLSYKGNIYGHFAKVSSQYLNVLQEGGHETKVIGHKIYKKYIPEKYWDSLPFKSEKDIFLCGTSIKRFYNKLCCVINILIVLLIKRYDLLIVHDNNQNLFYLIYSILPIKRKIALIRYTYPKNKKTEMLFDKVSGKISFIITSLKDVGESYKLPYVLVPDYFPMQQEIKRYTGQYDLCVVGTISECKDIETVIAGVKNTNLKLVIAGHFEDKERFNRVLSLCENYKNITVKDKYLLNDEYEKMIGASKFVVLPYNLESYENRSSGVVLDAIYAGKPVIATLCDAFMVVERLQIGFLYKKDFAPIIDKITYSNYSDLILNVLSYKDELCESKKVLMAMINKGI